MRASLQIGFTASDKVDDFGVARDDYGLLAILVFDLEGVPLLAGRACSLHGGSSQPMRVNKVGEE
jgi:hypothetical protein